MKTRQAMTILCVAVLMCAAFTGLQAQDRSSPAGAYGQTERPGTDGWQQHSRTSGKFSVETSLREFPTDTFFPSDTFNERAIQLQERAGIRNVGGLIQADARQVAGILKLDPREVQAAQQRLRDSIR